jgi:hypothetical protein
MGIHAGTADSGHSLHLRRYTVKHRKAAIQGSGSTPHHAAPGTKVSSAQEAEFAKSCVAGAAREMLGRERMFALSAAKVCFDPKFHLSATP